MIAMPYATKLHCCKKVKQDRRPIKFLSTKINEILKYFINFTSINFTRITFDGYYLIFIDLSCCLDNTFCI